MKTSYKKIFILLLIPYCLVAKGIDLGKFTKQKTINKAYIVNADAGIDITNSYGNVFVTTWDEDKIELDIVIKVSGDNEEWVTKRINDIDVTIDALKNLVTSKTKITNSRYHNNGNKNSFEINYIIKIPKNGGVKINNKYGDIISGDLFANTTINCEYGKITLAKLNGNINDITIGYCSKSTIEFVKNATINADYSGLSIIEFGKINLSADYTNLSFTAGNELKYNCSYGKLNLGKVNTILGNGDYVTIHINQIFRNLTIETSYSKITIEEIDAKANNIAINSDYTAVDLGYDSDYVFDFDVNIKYADFKFENELTVSSKQVSNSSKSYQGFNKKSGENKVSITSQYGKISLLKKQ